MRPDSNASPVEIVCLVQQSLKEAAAQPSHPWHWPVLVTAGEGRVVVLRFIDALHGSFRFYTDKRAAKVDQMWSASQRCAAVFYDPGNRIQLRVNGNSQAVSDKLRQAIWEQLPTDQQRNYATSQAPGTPIQHAHTGLSESWLNGTPSKLEIDLAYRNFAVYDVRMERFDFLVLQPDGNLRCTWKNWAGDEFRWVVP